MADDDDSSEQEQQQLDDSQKIDIAKWFLLNAPAGEINYVAKDLKTILNDENVYKLATIDAYPVYNKSHLISLQFPDRSGDVIISQYSEVSENEYLDPRTAQVATIDHVKQAITKVRPANDDELPSSYMEDFRCALDAEISRYVSEAYPKGVCAVYCVEGKEVEEPGYDFKFVVVISAARLSPKNFCNGSWRSIWTLDFNEEDQMVEIKGKLEVGAHYFEEGNVQLDANHECRDSTLLQNPEDSSVAITNIIRQQETEYLASLEASYLKLPDTTFKDLRRKLPVTRTLFPWHSTMQFSLTRDIAKELFIRK